MINAKQALQNVTTFIEKTDEKVHLANQIILKFLDGLIRSASSEGRTSVSVRVINGQSGDSIQTSDMGTSCVYTTPLVRELQVLQFSAGLKSNMLTISWDNKPIKRESTTERRITGMG